ncbi:MAG: hypothetical protein G01um101448_320 [Parcubacteria group bacterium Gr01-1014_48]|nr:MAG: hypothetical protein G01um101448_320 [Parcubacteria group bacterium Gr01-1014_48]TSD01484.1 MAG: hypothetical protein Greene101415_200 [Parcubacteria group bacterium Greene1014_15]TSD07144.1 MAG: hypothetical protein Greene07144_1002 [Parcubacteria group bacterium Greene0714_4]
MNIVIAFAALTLMATPVLACQGDDCPFGHHHRHHHHHHWSPPNPQSNVSGFNDAPVVAIINGGSLIVAGPADITNTAAGVLMSMPAGCGECPRGVNVSGVNTGPIDAIVNIGNAHFHGPLKLDNTAIGTGIFNADKK